MKFRTRSREEPEINLIPFIDVLLVVVIFLMLSTTYSKFTELQIRLPAADAQAQRDYPREVLVGVSSDGRYVVNKAPIAGRTVDELSLTLIEATQQTKDPVLVIHADANSAHQSVVTVMEAARRAGISQITFAAQSSSATASR